MPDHETRNEPSDPVAAAARLVGSSRRIVVLTGAGISTDSGIADYRGPNGIWTKNPAAEKMATLAHYVSDQEVRRHSWMHRANSAMFSAAPNAGHRALVSLERRSGGPLHTLITQNVDGLHQAAGSDPGLVIEVHGTVHQVVCLACGEMGPMEQALDRVRAGDDDPSCRTCGGILKSATISFGQDLVAADIERAFAAAEIADLFLAIGSTLAVYPVAETVPVARRAGAAVIIVNADPTPFDHLADVVVRGSISEVLPRIVAAN